MDQVRITRSQLRELAKKDEDVTILGDNQDARMLLVVPTRYEGDAHRRRWMKSDGRYRRDEE